MKEGSDSEQSNSTDPKMASARVIHPKPLNEVRPEEWEEIWGRLRLYVKANFDYVRKYGLSPDDIAQEVVANTMRGKRRWPAIDRSTGRAKDSVDLLTFLCVVAGSVASHMIEKEKRTVSLTDLASDDRPTSYQDRQRRRDEVMRSQADASPVSRLEYEDCIDDLRSAAGADTQLQAMAELLIERPDMTLAELAKALGVSIKEARSLRKVLRGNYGKKDSQKR
jgi:DNA-directed RNA polymerase specialized sigma24 family protein